MAYYKRPLNLGSSKSRRPSPKKLKASTVIAIAVAGATEHQGAVPIYERPVLTITPQLALPAGEPSPRKLKLASARIIIPILIVKRTIMRGSVFGNMCLKIKRLLEHPMEIPARINSSCLKDMTVDRIIRAKAAHPEKMRAREIDDKPGPRDAAMRMTSSNDGNARITSITRIIT